MPFLRDRPSSAGDDDGAPQPGSGALLDRGLPHLLDERSQPDFRAVYGTLARGSSAIDSAVARVRISGLNLKPDELRSVERIRLVLAEVNGITLRSESEAVLSSPGRGEDLLHILEYLEAGRIEVRSAPLAGWAPDFTVFHRKGGPRGVLVGPHWFARPYPHRGPALASVHGAGAAARLAGRFEELWRQAHDIGAAVTGLLRQARDRTVAKQGKGLRDKGKPAARRGRKILDTPSGSR